MKTLIRRAVAHLTSTDSRGRAPGWSPDPRLAAQLAAVHDGALTHMRHAV